MYEIWPGKTIDPAANYMVTGEALARLQRTISHLENCIVRHASGDSTAGFKFAESEFQLILPNKAGSAGGVDLSKVSTLTLDVCLPGGGTTTASFLVV